MLAVKLLFIACVAFISIGAAGGATTSGSLLDKVEDGGLETIGDEAFNEDKAPENSLQAVVANLAKIFLGVLGIIFVVLLILGGFKYMTAAGSEEKVSEAVKLIRNAAIGLLIVLAAYSITYFITEQVVPQITEE